MKRSDTLHNTHPGEILWEDVIKSNGLTISEVAAMLGVTRPTLSNIINEKSAITPNMALRIKTVFGGTADIWLKLQLAYDLRKEEKKFIANPPLLEVFV